MPKTKRNSKEWIRSSLFQSVFHEMMGRVFGERNACLRSHKMYGVRGLKNYWYCPVHILLFYTLSPLYLFAVWLVFAGKQSWPAIKPTCFIPVATPAFFYLYFEICRGRIYILACTLIDSIMTFFKNSRLSCIDFILLY